MMTRVLLAGVVGLFLVTGSASALSDADTGIQWIQAPTSQKIQVANILSRTLGGDPGTYVSCLNKIFADPEKAKTSIRDAAEQCKDQK